MKALFLLISMLLVNESLHATPAGLLARPDEPNCADLVSAASGHKRWLAQMKKIRTGRSLNARAITKGAWFTDGHLEGLKVHATKFGVAARLRGIGGNAGEAVAVWALTGPAPKLVELMAESPFQLTDYQAVAPTEILSGLESLKKDGNAFLDVVVNGATQRLSAFMVNTYFARRMVYLRQHAGLAVTFVDEPSVAIAIEHYVDGIVVANIKGQQLVIGHETFIRIVRSVDAPKLNAVAMPRAVNLEP